MTTELREKLGQTKQEAVMIGDDINARIGREGFLYNGEREENQGRKNSTDKTVNREGVKMLKIMAEQLTHSKRQYRG